MLEEFLRLVHDSQSTETDIVGLHEYFLDAFDSLLSFFGEITALTADEQYLALSH